MKLLILKIEGMRSVLCAGTIERAVCGREGVDAVNVDVAAGRIKIRCLDDDITAEEIKNIIQAAGYTAHEWQAPAADADDRHLIALRRQCLAAGALACISAVLTLLLSGRAFLALDGSMILALAAVETVLGLVALWPGRGIVLKGFGHLFSGRPCMESLTAISVSAALLYSMLSVRDLQLGNTLVADNIYASAAAAVIFWSLLGEYLTVKAEQRAPQPQRETLTAVLLNGGQEYQLAADVLLAGDLVKVRQGDRIPCRGVVEEGNAAVDEGDFTGASVPELKKCGMEVIAGSYVCGGEMTVRICPSDDEAAASQDRDTDAEPVMSAGDKRAAFFLPLILIAAVAVSLNWLFYSGSLGLAGKIFTAILLVTCPCALKMSAAAAKLQALAQASEQGLRFLHSGVLAAFKDVSVIIFGKTGTVSSKKMLLTDIVTYNGVKKEAALLLAASLENSSLHPVAGALKDCIGQAELLACEKPRYFPGEGISALCQQTRVCFGTMAYVRGSCRINKAAAEQAELWRKEGKTPLFLAVGKMLCAVVAVAEEVRPEARETVEKLEAAGVRTMLMTGDSKEAAERAAHIAGISKFMGGLSPQEKLDLVSSISSGGEKVAVVISSRNDYLGKFKAAVKIAAGTAETGRQQVKDADVVLEGSLTSLLQAVALSRKLQAAGKRSVTLFYLLAILLLPLAAGGFYFLVPGLLAQPVYVLAAIYGCGLLLLVNGYRI